MKQVFSGIDDLDERSRTIFRELVESYLQTGEPVGSRNISRQLPIQLSPASVRNIMSDLEALGLIYSPHTSAGRMPTERGLRLFVDGLLEVGDLAPAERRQIESQISGSQQDRSIEEMLTEAGEMISGLSHCAGVVLTDTVKEQQQASVKHIEFVPLEPGKALAVIVSEDNNVENRIIDLPKGLPVSALTEAANYLNAHITGMALDDARMKMEAEHKARKAELDALTQKVIESGLATWSSDTAGQPSLIVRGRSHLISELSAAEDIDRVRQLFDDFEAKQDIIQILNLAEHAEGVRIFIGSENKLFSMSGSSLIVAPFQNTEKKVVGVLGVIGPTRLNYARIIPMVDYTARLVGKLIS
ncbi:MAG: heat-inducible transcriptional repressor HrcA [Hyphomicrobiaceae bacterium]